MSKLLRLLDSPAHQRRGWRGLLVAAFLVELAMFTVGRGCLGPYVSPLVFGGAGLLLGGAGLGLLRDQPLRWVRDARAVRRVGWIGAAWLGGAVLVLSRQIRTVLDTPIDVHSSDVIPIVQAYVSRFRSGEVVYRYLTTLPYPLFPNHLPLQWLPYVPAQRLGFDFRWMSWFLLLGPGLGAYLLALWRRPGRWYSFGLRALVPALVLLLFNRTDGYMYALVLEPTIIAYYFVLAASVLSGRWWAQGLALALCLLSRYSVVFWVPLFLWMLWRQAGPRHTLLVTAIVAAGITGIYLVPFFLPDPTIFGHALAEYRVATLGEWSRLDAATGLPTHVSNGLNLLPGLYRLPLSLEDKVSWAQRLHAAAAGGTALVLAAFYARLGRRYDYRALAILFLKIYLVVFYLFIQIPYAYLISLSVLLSAFVLVLDQVPALATAPAART